MGDHSCGKSTAAWGPWRLGGPRRLGGQRLQDAHGRVGSPREHVHHGGTAAAVNSAAVTDQAFGWKVNASWDGPRWLGGQRLPGTPRRQVAAAGKSTASQAAHNGRLGHSKAAIKPTAGRSMAAAKPTAAARSTAARTLWPGRIAAWLESPCTDQRFGAYKYPRSQIASVCSTSVAAQGLSSYYRAARV